MISVDESKLRVLMTGLVYQFEGLEGWQIKHALEDSPTLIGLIIEECKKN